MAIASTDLVKYASANHPEDDTGTTGGAIDANTVMRAMTVSVTEQLKAKSLNAGDTTQTLTLFGRDGTGDKQNEGLTLNGTTLITFSGQSFERLHKATLSATAAGDVVIYKNDGTTEITRIPAGKTGVISSFIDGASESSQVERYIKETWRNDHGSLTLMSSTVKLTADPEANIKMAIENSDNQTATNRKTQPSGTTFADTDISVGSLAAGADVGIWMEQTLAADNAPIKSTYTTQLEGTSV